VTVRGDVSDDDDVGGLFDTAAELGQVTGPVSNAGLTARGWYRPATFTRRWAAYDERHDPMMGGDPTRFLRHA